MATALTGSAGWTGAHPFQLAGPPLVHDWTRPVPKTATTLVAHVYENDGCTPKGTFKITDRPVIKATNANGGLGQLILSVPTQIRTAVWGQFDWGTTTWGGKIVQGNVVRLTEDQSPWKGFVYGGIVEAIPDVRSSSGTAHQIVVSPFGVELTRVASQAVYTTGVDVVQVFREAVALTQHCHCDQISVPIATGVPIVQTPGALVDFRGQMVNSVMDTVRSMLGPTWYWFCDEGGRTWLQPQGSSAAYTLVGGAHYRDRSSNGGDISQQKNQVPATGGPDPHNPSQNVSYTANGSSQSGVGGIGIRTLDPPIQMAGVTDGLTLRAVADGVLATLDQPWTRVTVTVLPPRGIPNEKHPGRLHQSQPGGAMVRYREEPVNTLPESGAGSGYVGPFILQTHSWDGQVQTVELGNIPVTSETDIQNMVRRLSSRSATGPRFNPPAILNANQVLTGSLASGVTTAVSPSSGLVVPASQWRATSTQIAMYDEHGVRRVAQGNLPANGISPAGWKLEVDDQNGNPIFDSFGLIGVAALLDQVFNYTWSTSSTTDVVIPGVTVSFTLARQTNVWAVAVGTASNGGSGGTYGYCTLFVDGVNAGHVAPWNGPKMIFPINEGYKSTTISKIFGLPAGPHTIDLRMVVDNASLVLTGYQALLDVVALGG